MGEDGEQGESESRLQGETGNPSTAALAMSQFKQLCRQQAVDQPLGGKLVHRWYLAFPYTFPRPHKHISPANQTPLFPSV